jgi:hypothetical protein
MEREHKIDEAGAGVGERSGERSGGGAGRWLSGLMGSLCGQVEADLRRMPADAAVSIHALRVRMKKMRALLILCEGEIAGADQERLRGRIRELKNRFGGQRDSVVIEHLVARLQREVALPPLVLALGGEDGQELDGEGELLEILPQVRGQLGALGCELAELELDGLDAGELLEGYVGSYRRCRRAWRACESKASAARLHRWRKRVKELYFLSLALHKLGAAAACVPLAQGLGRRLGKINDLALLDRSLSGRGSGPWRAEVGRRRRRHERKIFAEARQLLGKKPKELRRELEEELAAGGEWWEGAGNEAGGLRGLSAWRQGADCEG